MTVTQNDVALKADEATNLVSGMTVIDKPPVVLFGTVRGTSTALAGVTLILGHAIVVVGSQAVVPP